MKIKHLIFFLSVSLFITAISFMPSVDIGNGTILERDELWSYGFGPATLVLGICLGAASIIAWRGSLAASNFCLIWAALYSLIIGGLSIYHFPNTVFYIVIAGVAWAVLWYFSLRSWVKNVAT
jgi:hypothetical protein